MWSFRTPWLVHGKKTLGPSRSGDLWYVPAKEKLGCSSVQVEQKAPKSLFLRRADRIRWAAIFVLSGKKEGWSPGVEKFILSPGDRKWRKKLACASMRFCPGWFLRLVGSLSSLSWERRVKMSSRTGRWAWTWHEQVRERARRWKKIKCDCYHSLDTISVSESWSKETIENRWEPMIFSRNGNFPSTF